MRSPVWLLASLMFCQAGCNDSAVIRPLELAGPDAAISSDPAASGPLVLVVQRPVYDRGTDGRTVDPRAVIAVLQPDRATWLAAGRLNAKQALVLVAAMQASLSAASPASEAHLALSLGDPLPAIGASGQRTIDGGHWKWVGLRGEAGHERCQMSLVDADGRVVARLSMDTATAAYLASDLDRIIRTSSERLTASTQKEHF